jgi:hypothetical protein
MATHPTKAVEGAKRGRPKIEIDYEQVKRMSQIGCTVSEIAHVLGVSESKCNHDKEFNQVYKREFDVARMSLRRAQRDSALNGNVTMQIWLGKQWLGQRDTVEVTDERLNKIDTLIDSINEVAKK